MGGTGEGGGPDRVGAQEGGPGAGGGILVDAFIISFVEGARIITTGGDGSTQNGGTVKLFSPDLRGDPQAGITAGRLLMLDEPMEELPGDDGVGWLLQ